MICPDCSIEFAEEDGVLVNWHGVEETVCPACAADYDVEES